MPYVQQYVLPDVFLEHNGVTIYRTYEDGEYNEQSNYHFCTNVDDADDNENESQFDVRELPGFKIEYPPYLTGENKTPENEEKWERFRLDGVEEKAMIAAIKHAIDHGILKLVEED